MNPNAAQFGCDTYDVASGSSSSTFPIPRE
jgi:hypothetical protein